MRKLSFQTNEARSFFAAALTFPPMPQRKECYNLTTLWWAPNHERLVIYEMKLIGCSFSEDGVTVAKAINLKNKFENLRAW
jgi:hypothetical protein